MKRCGISGRCAVKRAVYKNTGFTKGHFRRPSGYIDSLPEVFRILQYVTNKALFNKLSVCLDSDPSKFEIIYF